jgi:GT2 family glycosyltransferase
VIAQRERPTVPVTVVLPTIGRAELVRSCLQSLAACQPGAGEILVVDSSADSSVADVVETFTDAGATIVRCEQPGLGYAFNVGLCAARHDVVLLTNDDCTVQQDWVEVGRRLVLEQENAIITGRVRPFGDEPAVPSTIDEPNRRRHDGGSGFFLFTQSVALRPTEVLELGGFDGRIRPSAEDNDLSYRWLRAGRTIRYEPEFVVWHHDWRTRDQLDRLYVDYGVGQGMVYAKHLRRGDLVIGRFVIRDLYAVCRGLVDRAVRGRRPYGDWRLGLARGLPVGFVRGWRTYGSSAETEKVHP